MLANGCTDGECPYGGLVQASDGNFYGTTSVAAEPPTHGTVFAITPSGTLTTLHIFTGTDGANPYAGLIQATDGKFYGATKAGGTNNAGTVFSLVNDTLTVSTTRQWQRDQHRRLHNLSGYLQPHLSRGYAGDAECDSRPGMGFWRVEWRLRWYFFLHRYDDATLIGGRHVFTSAAIRRRHSLPAGGYAPVPAAPDSGWHLPDASRSARGRLQHSRHRAAYSLNVTVVPQGPLGYLTIWPTGEDQPVVSTLNSLDGRIKANAAIVPAGTSGAVSVYVTNTTDVILDIDGYFAPVIRFHAGLLSADALPRGRHAQVHFPPGLGPPHLSGRTPRAFPVLNATRASSYRRQPRPIRSISPWCRIGGHPWVT